jgi:putative membrane protein
MIFFLVFGLILGALSVIFALQNIVPIAVTFLFWQIQGSLALILLLAVLMGVLVGGLLSIPEVWKNRGRFKDLKKQKDELEKSLDVYKMKISEMEDRVRRLEAEVKLAEERKVTEPLI